MFYKKNAVATRTDSYGNRTATCICDTNGSQNNSLNFYLITDSIYMKRRVLRHGVVCSGVSGAPFSPQGADVIANDKVGLEGGMMMTSSKTIILKNI